MKKQDFLKSDAKVHIFLCSYTTFSKEYSKSRIIIDINQEGIRNPDTTCIHTACIVIIQITPQSHLAPLKKAPFL